MAIVKCLEVIAQSEKGWEDAAQEALREVSKTVHGIQSIWVKDLQAVVENDRITKYRLNAKISFIVDESR
jgi:flavin-binding protein dodecin